LRQICGRAEPNSVPPPAPALRSGCFSHQYSPPASSLFLMDTSAAVNKVWRIMDPPLDQQKAARSLHRSIAEVELLTCHGRAGAITDPGFARPAGAQYTGSVSDRRRNCGHVEGRPIVHIEDVMTLGRDRNAASRAQLRGGAKRVGVLAGWFRRGFAWLANPAHPPRCFPQFSLDKRIT
jgi:hypothetical protein